MINRFYIINIVLFLLSVIILSGDPVENANALDSYFQSKSTIQNNTGYSNEFQSSMDGNLSVSESNLNASYTIPLSSKMYNGTNVNFSLNYHGGIEHRALQGMRPIADVDYTTFSKKIPTWFLSVNGFVVQAFVDNRTIFADIGLYSKSRYNESYLTDVDNNGITEKKYIFSNKDFNFSIKGYHYNNSITPSTMYYSQYDYHYNKDKINILRSNGSLLTLINPRSVEYAADQDNHRTGIYYEFGINSQGYAIVTEIEDNYTCTYPFGEEPPKRRKVRYFPGDGTEYVFVEYMLPYGPDYGEVSVATSSSLFESSDENFNLTRSDHCFHPTIFYLSEIINDNQVVSTFYYDRHHPYEGQFCGDNSFGRAKLQNFNDNWIEYGNGVVNIRTSDKEYIINLEKTGYKDKMKFITAYGGGADNWIKSTENGNEIQLYEPGNLPAYIDAFHRYSDISNKLAKNEMIYSDVLDHSINSEEPRSDQHYYILHYVDNIEIIENQDNQTNDTPKKIKKQISFVHDTVIKKLNNISISSGGRNPAVPFLNNTMSKVALDEIPGLPGLKYENVLSSSIHFRDLRLTKIIEPTKEIEIEYLENFNSTTVNSIDMSSWNVAQNGPDAKKTFRFSNNLVDSVKYYDREVENFFTKKLYMTQGFDTEFSLFNDFGIQKVKTNIYTRTYNTNTGTPLNSTETEKEFLEYDVDFQIPGQSFDFLSFNNKVSLPIKVRQEFISNIGLYNNYALETKYNYLKLEDSFGEDMNFVKPSLVQNWVEQGGIKKCNSIKLYTYEMNDKNEDLKELSLNSGFDRNTQYGRVINKKTEYTLPLDENEVDYASVVGNVENIFIDKTEYLFENFKRESYTNINIEENFVENQSAILKKYYDDSWSNFSDDFGSSYQRQYNSTSSLNSGNSSKNIPNSKDNSKNSKVQTTSYDLAADEFSLEYSLCYLLNQIRTDPNYTSHYGHDSIVAKPLFGVLKSVKKYVRENGSNLLLKGVEYELEDEAYNGTNLTYSRGKVIKEELLESEYYGGSSSNSIISKEIEYSVGNQGGGYPSKIYYANGAMEQNYYVYNQSLHYNKSNSNPVYTVQDYWPPFMVDDENFPCRNQDYFLPAGKVVHKDNSDLIKESKDKLVESKNVFSRVQPVANRKFVRKFKPGAVDINYHDNFPNNNEPFIVNENTYPSSTSGSFYSSVNNEILSLNTVNEFNDVGQVTAAIDQNYYTTRFEYDAFNRLKKVNRPYDYSNSNLQTETINQIICFGLSSTRESLFDVIYVVDKDLDNSSPPSVTDCKAVLLSIDKKYDNGVEVSAKEYFDFVRAGGEKISNILEIEENDWDDYSNNELYLQTTKRLNTSLISFRLPKRVKDIENITSATLLLNLKDVSIQEGDKIRLYLKIRNLDETSTSSPFEKMITLEYSEEQEVLMFDDGYEPERQIAVHLGNYIDLEELKNLLMANSSSSTGLSFSTTPLEIEISAVSFANETSGSFSLESFKGTIDLFQNTNSKSLAPRLTLFGEFEADEYKDRDYFTRKQYTMYNNYGNFGTYLNSYNKIDNNATNGDLEFRYLNNYTYAGFDYKPRLSKTYNYNFADDNYFESKMYSSLNSINSKNYTFDYNSNLIEEEKKVYDLGGNNIANITTESIYDGSGRNIQTQLNNGQTFDVEYGYTDGNEFVTNFPDIEFYGLANKVLSIEESTIGTEYYNLDVSDMFGNKVLSFVNIEQSTNPNNWNPDPDLCSKVLKYYYDLNQNLTRVSEHLGSNTYRDIFYWYDSYGQMKHTYHPDFGYTHYTYDNSGNLRFKQDQKQSEENKVTYYEYDDLNRITVTGEAKINPSSISYNLPIAPTPANYETIIFNTMLDAEDSFGELIINPNILNDGGVSVDGNNNRVLTSNKTLWGSNNSTSCYVYDGIINDTVYSTNGVPLTTDIANSILGTSYEFPPKGIVHKNYLYNDIDYSDPQNIGANASDFEDLDTYNSFLRRVNFYDEIPERYGRFWKLMPKEEFISYLSYDDDILNDEDATLYNLKGRIAVQAYREYENQPFNFIYYSYDARGRISSMIRFTENIGFDCMYYKYNSMDLITHTIAMGPNVSVKTAYEYDDYARLENVYSEVGDGHGLADLSGTDYLNGSAPVGNLNISFLDIDNYNNPPDITFSYDSDGKINSKQYNPGLSGLVEDYDYESTLRKLERIDVYDNSSMTLVFTELIDYDNRSRILEIDKTHRIGPVNVYDINTLYDLDDIGQLKGTIVDGNSEEAFNYDNLGNRTLSYDYQDAPFVNTNYIYEPNKTWLINASQAGVWYNNYTYFNNGQLETRHKAKKVKDAQPGGPDAVWKHTKEEFSYNTFGLLKEYEFDYYYGDDDCDLPLDHNQSTKWRYGYNPFNERESKKMIKSYAGDSEGNVYASMYYMLDEKNKQHINYVGVQTSDLLIKSIINDNKNQIDMLPNMYPDYFWPTCLLNLPGGVAPSKSEQVIFYPAQLNVYVGNSLPHMSYQYDRETSTWEKYYNIYDHQGSLQQQYLLTNDNSIPPNYSLKPTIMQDYYPYGEVRWQMDDLANENKNNQNWIGKEKDKENGLGDHGVRKYEYETGRFTSIDPLWNKYYGWTPFQYSLNSPITFKDDGGMEVEAADAQVEEYIKNSVEKEYRDYVKFENGIAYVTVPLAPLKSSMNSNYMKLQYLINHDMKIKVSEIDNKQEFTFVFGGETNNTYVNGPGNEMALYEYTTPGITLYPYNSDVDFQTSGNYFQIYINRKNYPDGFDKNKVPNSKAKTTAHELFLHVYSYLTGRNYSHEGNDDNWEMIKEQAK